jgi:ATP-dependent helicase HepA
VKKRRKTVVTKAVEAMKVSLSAELDRLQDLAEVNPMIGDHEIEVVKTRQEDLEKALKGARIRLDALRLIYKTQG